MSTAQHIHCPQLMGSASRATEAVSANGAEQPGCNLHKQYAENIPFFNQSATSATSSRPQKSPLAGGLIRPEKEPQMNTVILSVDGVPVTTSIAIAEGTKTDHASVIKLVRSYQGDLEEFGMVGFEIQPKTPGFRGGSDTEYAILNEQQSTLLITYMRNSDVVRHFKKRLVKEFWDMRRIAAPVVPQSLSSALRMAADQAEQIEVQQAQLAIAAPKVAFVDQYVESSGLKGFRQVAKLLKANEARLREFLGDKKIMYRLGGEWAAYQPHIDAGRFDVKTGTNGANQHNFTTTLFTPKGIEWLSGLWAVHCLNGGVVGAMA